MFPFSPFLLARSFRTPHPARSLPTSYPTYSHPTHHPCPHPYPNFNPVGTASTRWRGVLRSTLLGAPSGYCWVHSWSTCRTGGARTGSPSSDGGRPRTPGSACGFPPSTSGRGARRSRRGGSQSCAFHAGRRLCRAWHRSRPLRWRCRPSGRYCGSGTQRGSNLSCLLRQKKAAVAAAGRRRRRGSSSSTGGAAVCAAARTGLSLRAFSPLLPLVVPSSDPAPPPMRLMTTALLHSTQPPSRRPSPGSSQMPPPRAHLGLF